MAKVDATGTKTWSFDLGTLADGWSDGEIPRNGVAIMPGPTTGRAWTVPLVGTSATLTVSGTPSAPLTGGGGTTLGSGSDNPGTGTTLPTASVPADLATSSLPVTTTTGTADAGTQPVVAAAQTRPVASTSLWHGHGVPAALSAGLAGLGVLIAVAIASLRRSVRLEVEGP
jgi:hypothetical protein